MNRITQCTSGLIGMKKATTWRKFVISPWTKSGDLGCHRRLAFRHLGGASATNDTLEQLEQRKHELLQEAKSLTLSVYRTCMRSIRLIRHGNDHDEAEFQRLEQKRINDLDARSDPQYDVRLGSWVSLLPPVDRVDELRSRAEYYMQYARENFVQESDCLDDRELWESHRRRRTGRDELGQPVVSSPTPMITAIWQEKQISRFVNCVRLGDSHRQWLLSDMKFPDPYQAAAHGRAERLDEFQHRAQMLIQEQHEWNNTIMRRNADEETDHIKQESCMNNEADANESEIEWSDSDDDGESNHPSWFKNPRSE